MISPLFRVSGHEAKGLLYGLLEVNKLQLRENPGLPSMRRLIQTGRVRYNESDPDEHWKTYREMVEEVERDGVAYGDCEDLGTAVAAEDQIKAGVPSLPYAYSPREGLYHVVTAVPSSSAATYGAFGWPGAMGAPRVSGYTLIDPSAAAGMPVRHVGVRGEYGALSVPRRGVQGAGTSPQVIAAFLEGLGLSGLGIGDGEEAARTVGRLLALGAGKAANAAGFDPAGLLGSGASEEAPARSSRRSRGHADTLDEGSREESVSGLGCGCGSSSRYGAYGSASSGHPIDRAIEADLAGYLPRLRRRP